MIGKLGKVCLCLLLTALSCAGKSDQQMIQEMVDRIGELAEKRDAAGLTACLDEGYVDFEGRDKAATAEMVSDYFSRYRGIVIHVLSTRIVAIDSGGAAIQSEVVISSGAAEAFRKLVRFVGEYYRFTCRLVKRDGDWLVSSAEWQTVETGDLFPESLRILRSIFPDL